MKERIFTGIALIAMAVCTYFAVTAHAAEAPEKAETAAEERLPGTRENGAEENVSEDTGPSEETGRSDEADHSGIEAEKTPFGWIPGSHWAVTAVPDEIPVSRRIVEKPLSDGSGTEMVTVYDRFLGWAETAEGEPYPVFDEPPVIAARDLSVTDMELLFGLNLQQALLDRAEVQDREDSYPGGVRVTVFSFDRNAFYSGNEMRSVTATLKAEDSAGNVSYTTFEVTRTTGRLSGMNRFGWGDLAAADDYIRSIDLASVHREAPSGGLSTKSIWRKKSDYAAALAEALFRLQEKKYLVTFSV